MKHSLAAACAISLLSFSSLGQTNQWIKPTSGNWEEASWSLGQLPGTSQDLVAIDNDGWKAVVISENTTINHPDSLSLKNLLVDGPTNSLNTLLLNWAKLSVPLIVQSNLTIGTNGSLVSHYSALKVANAYIDGSAAFMDYATEDFGQLWLGSGSTLGLTNGTMTCSNLTFYDGTFTQSGGTHVVQTMNLPIHSNEYSSIYGAYELQGGVLASKQLILGYVMAPFGANGDGFFIQSGGVHTNSATIMTGYHRPGGGMFAGVYELKSGLLVSSNFVNDGGNFLQSGGTNIIGQLNVVGGSYFGLSGGELIVSNAVTDIDTYVSGRFEQLGGKQTVLGELLVQGGGYGGYWADPEYRVSGGSLVVSNLAIVYGALSVYSNAFLLASNINLQGRLRVADRGVISNARIIAVSGKTYPEALASVNIDVANPTETQYLGQLQVFDGCTIQYYAPSNSTAVRFADSHALPWTGQLQVWLSGPSPGAHIFFGDNAQGLSAVQLAQVEFIRDIGGQYKTCGAVLLPTGELVPIVPLPMGWTNCGQSLVLTWSGSYQLCTATNLFGPYTVVPGATSPFTNECCEPQRFFRLQLPTP
jgi:hypothetical protein